MDTGRVDVLNIQRTNLSLLLLNPVFSGTCKDFGHFC